jgi:hypothetical protein
MVTASSNLVPMTEPRVSAPRPVWTGKTTCRLLTPTEYGEWDSLVDRSPHGTIFHNSWWLDAATGSVRILGVRNEADVLLGGLPVPQKNSAGLKLLHQPILTPYLGPIFDLSATEGICDQLHLMRACGEALARNLGEFDSFRYLAGALAPDLQGFLWAGFRVGLAYTFRFSSSQTPADITQAMTRTHLQKLTKAKRLNLQAAVSPRIEPLLDLNKMTFQRKDTTPPFDDALVTRLWQQAMQRQRADVYVASSEEGRPIAALFTVHDRRTTYQIISGFDPACSDMPGQNLVLWTAVQDALACGRDFDFEGSAIRGVETFYRRWGANAVPVWRIEKAGSLRGQIATWVIERRQSAARNSNAVAKRPLSSSPRI